MKIQTPAELERRTQEIGALIGDACKAVRADELTIERSQVLYDAIQTWWSTSLSEEERKAAYHTLASHKCTDPSEMEKIVQRYHRAKDRLP